MAESTADNETLQRWSNRLHSAWIGVPVALAAPAVILLWWGVDVVLVRHAPAAFLNWVQLWVTRLFPEPNLIVTYQNQVLGVAATLLALSFTIVVVSYSASEIDRSVVRAVILRSPATMALFGFFCGTIGINAFIALTTLAYPSIAWAQAVNIVLSLVGITWYFVWFSQALNLPDIASKLTKLPMDPTEKTILLMRVLQDAAERRRSDDIRAVLQELTEAIVQGNNRLCKAAGMRQAFRENVMTGLGDAAAEAIRTSNDVLLRELIEAVFDLAAKLAHNDSQWHSAFQDWFLGWYGEFLRASGASSYSNPYFNKIYRYLRQLTYIRATERRSRA